MNNIIKSWNDKQIRIRADRYVSLTDMAQACGKQVNDFLRLKQTQSYLDALSNKTGIPVMASQQWVQTLLEVRKGGDVTNSGTWGHPKVAICFARWCNDDLAVQMDFWIDELLTTGSVSLKPKTKIQILAELTAQMAENERIQIEHGQKLSEHDTAIGVLESELAAFKNSDGHFMTIVGYANINGVRLDKSQSQRLGKEASKLYREETGTEPKKKEDEGYGFINVYPRHILERVFASVLV